MVISDKVNYIEVDKRLLAVYVLLNQWILRPGQRVNKYTLYQVVESWKQ